MAIFAFFLGGGGKHSELRRKFMLVTNRKITVRENICLMQNVNFTSDYDSSDLLIPFMIEPAHCSLINSFS